MRKISKRTEEMYESDSESQNSDDWESVCSTITQFSNTNDGFFPCCIDYGGTSNYLCEMHSSNQFSILGSRFNGWRKVLDDSAQQNERDINNIIQYDTVKLANYFRKWKRDFTFKNSCRVRWTFSQWKILFNFRLKEKDNFRQKARQAIRYWKYAALFDLLKGICGKILVKRLFKEWKKQSKLNYLVPRARKIDDRVRSRYFFKKWKSKSIIHRRNRCSAQLKAVVAKNILKSCYDLWREKYLFNVRKLDQRKRITQKVLIKWKAKQAYRIAIKHSELEVETSVATNIMLKTFIKWKLRYTKSKERRYHSVVNKWARVSVREILYTRVQLLRLQILVSSVWRHMKERAEVKKVTTKQEYFDIWQLFIKRKKQAKEVKRVCYLFQITRCFGRWKSKFDEADEHRQIQYVKTQVIEPLAKSRYFHTWLDSAIRSFKQSQVKAIKFRKNHLKQIVFKSWHHNVEILQLRATEYRKRKVLKQFFGLFKEVTLGVLNEKTAIAIEFNKKVLLQRYLNRFQKTVVPQTEDAEYDWMIRFFNQSVFPSRKVSFL